MRTVYQGIRLGALACVATVALSATAAFAAPILTSVNTDFTASSPVSFSYGDSTFTFTGTGDIFQPTSLQTSGTGEARSFGGFLGFPLTPSTDFYPARGSGVIVYDASYNYSPFTTSTTIPYSNGGNILGLLATLDGETHYGFAYTQDNKLVGYGFESAANIGIDATAGIATISAVPEPASWVMMIGGMGLAGGMMRRRHRTSEKAFTVKVRSVALGA